jgi:hypothetical protein
MRIPFEYFIFHFLFRLIDNKLRPLNITRPQKNSEKSGQKFFLSLLLLLLSFVPLAKLFFSSFFFSFHNKFLFYFYSTSLSFFLFPSHIYKHFQNHLFNFFHSTNHIVMKKIFRFIIIIGSGVRIRILLLQCLGIHFKFDLKIIILSGSHYAQDHDDDEIFYFSMISWHHVGRLFITRLVDHVVIRID